tara:strand:- start:179171 stop:179581 length:411 start_codon:yes stop_codon:yes gene_type:complete
MIIGYYAALLALLFIFLTLRVGRARMQTKIGIGDGGDHNLQKAIRAHANFAEFVPLALLLLFMIEMQQSSVLLLHTLGALLFVGRVLHALGLSKTSKLSFGRMVGAGLTALVITVSALWLLYAFSSSHYLAISHSM